MKNWNLYFSWCRIHAPMFMDDCKMPLWNVHPIYYPEMTIFTHGRFALILIILHSNWPWNGYVFFWKAFDENILGIWHWMAESALADLPVNLTTWICDIIKISSCQAKSFLSPQTPRLKNKMKSNYLQHNTKNGSLLNLFDGTEATILPSPNSFPFPPLPPSPPHPPSPAMAQVLSLSLFLSSLFLSTSNFLKASLIFTFHSHPYRNQF